MFLQIINEATNNSNKKDGQKTCTDTSKNKIHNGQLTREKGNAI